VSLKLLLALVVLFAIVVAVGVGLIIAKQGNPAPDPMAIAQLSLSSGGR
jgi:hypothetical protein